MALPLAGALAFASQIFDLLPAIISGVSQAKEFIEWGRDKIKTFTTEDRNPTDEEWAELNAKTEELRSKLHSDET